MDHPYPRHATIAAALLLSAGGALTSTPASAVGACALAANAEEDIEGEAPLAGGEINYRVRGPVDGAPVFFIHGLTGSQQTWDDTIDRFAATYRVITYDQRGHGRTVARGERYTNTTMARDLAALMTHLGIESAHIVGHSMGGRTALKFASLYPARVRSVVVEDMHIDTRPFDPEHVMSDVRALRALPKEWDTRDGPLPALRRLYDAYVPGYAESMLDWMVRGAGGKWRMGVRLDVAELYEMYALREDLAPTLQLVRARTMFLQATENPILSAAGARRIRAVRPDVEVVRVQGADHGIHHSKLNEFVDLVSRFVARP